MKQILRENTGGTPFDFAQGWPVPPKKESLLPRKREQNDSGLRSARFLWLFLPGLLALVGLAAQAGGPLFVGGPGMLEGQPFKWDMTSFPSGLTYWTDKGNLGNQTNAQADTLVADAFLVWQAVPTATISFSRSGALGADVTASNIASVFNAIAGCGSLAGTPARDPNSIIYDVDGSATAALGLDPNSVLGFAALTCADFPTNSFTRGVAVLNGKFIDGQPDTPTNPEVTLAEFKAVSIHEFGHLIGLDHSQINLNCLTAGCAPGSDDLVGVPTMFPVLLDVEQGTLATDDIAAVSELYPEASFAMTTGRIQGRILFPDGSVQAQGYNVIARQVNDPGTPAVDESRRIAVSSVSGFRYTACVGTPVTGDCGSLSAFGSRDPTLIGFYDIPGLPPGSYTVEVEAINNSSPRPFVDGSSVGPIGNLGFQFPLPPGTPPEFWDVLESATDNPLDSSPVTVSAGPPGPDINIILNNTPPDFDAWETAWLQGRIRTLAAWLRRSWFGNGA